MVKQGIFFQKFYAYLSDLSSDGSPVSTPGHSPYSSCTNLANIDDEFSGFDDDIEGRNQCKLNFGKICQNKDVILTNCLDMEKTDDGSERPAFNIIIES
jgi:hypothetical protein